jgi:hypothetical protein
MYTQCLTTDATLKANVLSIGSTMTGDLIADASIIEDCFATTPALPAVSTRQVPDEEELHTSFEHAISGRLIAVNRRLSLISGPLTNSEQEHFQVTSAPQLTSIAANESNHQPLPGSTNQANIKRPEINWQLTILLASLALMFLLAGYDIMGLLVLLAH